MTGNNDDSTYTAWAYYDLPNALEVLAEDLRTYFGTRALGDAPDYEQEEAAHITIHPWFEAPESARDALQDALTACEGVSVQVDGLDFFPSRECPMVVSLDVTVPGLDERRAPLMDAIKAAGGEHLYDPVPAHITLWKAGDGDDHEEWDGPSEETHTALLEAFDEMERELEPDAEEEYVYELPSPTLEDSP